MDVPPRCRIDLLGGIGTHTFGATARDVRGVGLRTQHVGDGATVAPRGRAAAVEPQVGQAK
jgi:hypothetical protein